MNNKDLAEFIVHDNFDFGEHTAKALIVSIRLFLDANIIRKTVKTSWIEFAGLNPDWKAVVEGDDRSFFGFSEGEAIGKLIIEYTMNFGPILWELQLCCRQTNSVKP